MVFNISFFSPSPLFASEFLTQTRITVKKELKLGFILSDDHELQLEMVILSLSANKAVRQKDCRAHTDSIAED